MIFAGTAVGRNTSDHHIVYHVLWSHNRWLVRTDSGRVIGFSSARDGAIAIATRAARNDDANGISAHVCLDDEVDDYPMMH